MKITVAICTWNRSELLDQTLDQMTKLSIPKDIEWELLVVNNNSTDNTDEIIKKYETKLPIRRLFEPVLGLSNARNRALQEARGDYIIWTDNDVLIDKEWIAEYCKAFRRWPNVVIFGGPIKPFFEGIPPDWLKQCYGMEGAAYALLDLGEKAIPLTVDSTPFGANYAIRTKEHLRYPYIPSLGNKGDRWIGGEETFIIMTMLNDGLSGQWVPHAQVQHYITKERQTINYLLRITYLRNTTNIQLMQQYYKTRMLFGAPKWIWKAAIKSGIDYCIHRLFSKPEVWVEDLTRAAYLWGSLRGYSAKQKRNDKPKNI